ncbi:hypothetical protein [Marinilactibacillus psychrotolerans]|uniref:hypothetical protein n=1 Tax=Marinilactibacillus psychrotolerans TaxID=191770 RepID=UPI00388B8009
MQKVKNQFQHNNNGLFHFVFITTLLILIFILVYFSSLKVGFHIDEIYTFGLSNGEFTPFPYLSEQWINPSYYYDYLTVDSNDAFNYTSVYYNQTQDVHPPLFYFLTHFFHSIFTEQFTHWINNGINIIFYLLIFILIYKISMQVIQNRWFSYSVSLFWGLSIGAISSVMFLRMYVMLTFFCISLLLLSLKYLDSYSIFRNLIYIFITIFLGALTQYYFFVYSFFTIGILCILLIIRKKFKKFILVGITSLLGILSAYIFFPSMVDHIKNSDRGVEAFENVSTNSNNLIEFLKIVNQDLFGNLAFIIGPTFIILILIYFIIRLSRKQVQLIDISNIMHRAELLSLIFIPAIIYFVLIQKIAPYQLSRYIFNIYPNFIIGFSLILYLSLKYLISISKYISLIFISLVSISTIAGFYTQDIKYLYSDYQNTLNTVQEYQQSKVLILSSANWRNTGYISELIHYTSIYPHVVSEDKNVPQDLQISSNENLVVYIDNNLDKEIMDKDLLDLYGLKESKKLYDRGYGTAYLYTN